MQMLGIHFPKTYADMPNAPILVTMGWDENGDNGDHKEQR